MTTHELQVSILAAPVAAMDRRAVSQAWYSALGLAPHANQVAGFPRHSAAATAVRAQARSTPSAAATRIDERSTRPTVRNKLELRAGIPAVKYRALLQRRALAKQIERAFADPAAPPKRATISMGRGNARVRVILQTNRTGTTLLALCRPEIRAVVGRALAQARCALAARGIGIEIRVPETFACS
jgi:hypothetical protein